MSKKKSWPVWVVCDELGRPWLSTISKSRRLAVLLWRDQNAGDREQWKYWKRQGYSCQQMTLRT